MKWVELSFRLALRLYPRSFYERFAEEMREVFHHTLEQARAQGDVAPFLLRELVHLPGSLASVYAWAIRAQGEGQLALSTAGGTVSPATGGQRDGWGAALLAGLPHLLIGLLAGVPMLMNAAYPGWSKVFNDRWGWLSALVLFLMVLSVLGYSLRRGWQRWSASWLLYLAFLPLALLLVGVQSLGLDDPLLGQLQGIVWVIFPTLFIYLLYKIACSNRLRGLLAAVPMALILWSLFQEFVPDLLRGSAYVVTWGLAFAAAALILRVRRMGPALALAIGATALGGLLFVYLSVYYGGTLPFSEPGPSLREVFRQFIPFLGISCAVLLGPQLAAMLRALGREARAEGGVAYARLALGGLLLALETEIFLYGLSMGGGFGWVRYLPIFDYLPVGAGILYMAGMLLLVRAAIRSGALSGHASAALRLALLAIALPGVPITTYITKQGVNLGNTPPWGPMQAVYLVWILVAAWVASREDAQPEPAL